MASFRAAAVVDGVTPTWSFDSTSLVAAHCEYVRSMTRSRSTIALGLAKHLTFGYEEAVRAATQCSARVISNQARAALLGAAFVPASYPTTSPVLRFALDRLAEDALAPFSSALTAHLNSTFSAAASRPAISFPVFPRASALADISRYLDRVLSWPAADECVEDASRTSTVDPVLDPVAQTALYLYVLIVVFHVLATAHAPTDSLPIQAVLFLAYAYLTPGRVCGYAERLVGPATEDNHTLTV